MQAGQGVADTAKRDPAAVGRPGREVLDGGIGRQPEGQAPRDGHHVDVGVVACLARPRERHLQPIGREGRALLLAGKGGELNEPWLRHPPGGPSRGNGDGQPDHHDGNGPGDTCERRSPRGPGGGGFVQLRRDFLQLQRDIRRALEAPVRAPCAGSAGRSSRDRVGGPARAGPGPSAPSPRWPRASPPTCPAERVLPRQQLVEHDAEARRRRTARPPPAPGPARATCSATVPITTPPVAVGCVAPGSPSAVGGTCLASPKSRIFNAAVRRDEEVLGLDVAVDDARAVRGGEAVRRRAPRRRGPPSKEGARRSEPLPQCLALEQLRDDVRCPRVGADVVDGEDAGSG